MWFYEFGFEDVKQTRYDVSLSELERCWQVRSHLADAATSALFKVAEQKDEQSAETLITHRSGLHTRQSRDSAQSSVFCVSASFCLTDGDMLFSHQVNLMDASRLRRCGRSSKFWTLWLEQLEPLNELICVFIINSTPNRHTDTSSSSSVET